VRSLRGTGCTVVHQSKLDSKPFDQHENKVKVLQRISFTIEDVQNHPLDLVTFQSWFGFNWHFAAEFCVIT
jgi:hypothetical protein